MNRDAYAGALPAFMRLMKAFMARPVPIDEPQRRKQRTLSRAQRAAIRLDDRSTSEVAKAFGCARSTVRRVRHQGEQEYRLPAEMVQAIKIEARR